jgi:putative ABC transport system substrate-binding protein
MMTSRRRVLAVIGSTAIGWPLALRAQRPAAIPRIGYLSVGSPQTNAAFLGALKDALRDLGYVEGKNIAFDVEWAGGRAYDFPQLAASVVRRNPNAIVTTCIPSTRAAKQATGTIPVVMSVDGDPVATGLVASLAHPGANITGSSTLFEVLIPKWLELILLAAPQAKRIGILRNPENMVDPYFWALSEEAAKRSGVVVVPVEARVRTELDGAFAAMRKQNADALVVMTEAFLAGQADLIVPLALRHRLPAIYGFREFVEAGGLMSYGLSYRDYYKGVARYVDAVLKGAKPANLPVEQPTKIELVVNLPAAHELGLKLSPQLLARADRVIE